MSLNLHLKRETLFFSKGAQVQDISRFSNSPHTVVALLKACAKLKEVEKGHGIHVEIVKLGFEKDLFVGSTLLDVYVKCGLLDDASQVFSNLPGRNVVSWNALIAGYAFYGLLEDVLGCLESMQAEGTSPNAVTFTSALKACCSLSGDLLKSCELHKEVVKRGLDSDLFIGSILVDAYAKCGLALEAQGLFDKLSVKDIVSWMALVAGYAEHGPGQGALKCLQQMQVEGVSPDAAIFACVLKACGGTGLVHDVKTLHMDVVQRGFEMDPYVAGTLVDVYAKFALVVDARGVFDKLSDQSIVPLNALLAGYAEFGPCQEAWSCFEKAEGTLSLNAGSYVCVLKALGCEGAVVEGRKVHGLATQNALENDLFTGNSLIDMYAKCGSLTEAEYVFSTLKERSVVSWTALISGYMEHGPVVTAMDYFEEMQADGFIPDITVFSFVLKGCSSLGALERGREVHKVTIQMGFEMDPLVSNTLVDMYAKCRCFAEAQQVFYQSSTRNVASWTTLVALHTENGVAEDGLSCFDHMIVENVVPDAGVFACALNACGDAVDLEKGQEIHAKLVQQGVENEEIIGSSIVDMYAKCGSLLEAQATFGSLKEHVCASWNALITAHADCGRNQEALTWFEQMKLKGIHTDAVTYVSVLKACNGLKMGYDLHSETVRKGFEGDSFVGNTLVHMYAKCGAMLEAQKMFDGLQVRTIVSWNALIAGYADHGPYHEALACYENMQLEPVHQTSVSFLCVLKACGLVGALNSGQEIHAHIIQAGVESEVSISCTLVDMYAKCGSLPEAKHTFDKLSTRDVVAWNAMIKGYGLNLESDLAVKFFGDMQEEGVAPNNITFLCLLTACSHNNLVVKGQEFFKLMIEEYDIMPDLDHFSCMVDLFARSGSLSEAEKFLEALPCFPSKDIWMPLLNACKNHTEVELGHKCFEQLLNTDPDCATSYMLMSNIYASVG